jgi:hypothetical protein
MCVCVCVRVRVCVYAYMRSFTTTHIVLKYYLIFIELKYLHEFYDCVNTIKPDTETEL